MLSLKKLELFGFKSFCDRQELRFSGDGIAAIVGPNGCGKSNIGDAISWVIGEQSAKSLRGARMQDLIFNGSRDRKPSGLASISLTLVDPEAYLAARNGTGSNGVPASLAKRPEEMVVTRKLFRSGESQYLINGKTCRLRDVRELFMGTGLGPQHYAIIEQGRIEQILSSRPVDRRAFVEEAAGVTMFKTKKRLAELKLESARQNLDRVNDILQEVTRQVNSLKRQASRAHRHEELRNRLEATLSVLLASRYRRLDEQLRSWAAESDEAVDENRLLTERLRRLESELTSHRKQQQLQDTALASGREELSQLVVNIERLRSRVEQQAATAKENEKREKQWQAQISYLAERLEQLQTELASEEAALERVAAGQDIAQQALMQKTSDVEQCQAGLAEDEREQERGRQRILQLLGEIAASRNEVAKLEEFLAGTERRIAGLQKEEEDAQQEIAGLAGRRKEAELQVERERKNLEALAARRKSIEQQIGSHREQAVTGREQVERLQEELSRARARRDSLEEILSHHAYTAESVKNFFAAIDRRAEQGFHPTGILADYVEVASEHERVAEDFLRDELEFVVVKSWKEARQGVRLVRRDLHGEVTFLVHPDSSLSEEIPALGPETGVTGRLADSIRLTNGLSGAASSLLPRLRGCYLVEDEEAARRLAVQYPDLSFLLPDGVCYRGHTVRGGKPGTSGPLSLKRELRELTPKIAAAETSLREALAMASRAEDEIENKSAELETVKSECQETEKRLLAGEHELRRLDEEIDRAERQRSVASVERERLQHTAQEASADRDARSRQIAQKETERGQCEKLLADLEQRIRENQGRLASLLKEQTQARTQLATLEERHKGATASSTRSRQRVEEQNERMQSLSSQMRESAEERVRLLEDNLDLESRIEQQCARRVEAEREASEIAGSLAELRGRVETSEEQIGVERLSLDEIRDQRSTIDVRLAEIRSEVKHLEEECRREIGKPIREVSDGESADLADEELAAAEAQHQETKAKLDSLGPVNVLALEEFQEAKERLDFLEAQKKDLVDSIADTQRAIGEIDAVSRRKFQDAFEAINKNFHEVFRTLFGGGQAEMKLTDESNAADSGIDIIASPPGKRLQNVALLSGGEKSLTAVALLMATFQYKPSPFCVLDEVDAALDEPNLARFSRLVSEMSDRTQFILITHSKTTMETAQTLYGVTMQQPGVSQLVSVRMADHENGRAATSQRATERG